MLGLRELVFLRHLNSRIPSRSHFCITLPFSIISHFVLVVKVCDAFVSNEQLSLVFPCYDGTLIDYIVKNPVAAQSESQQSLTPINSRSKVILQPKYHIISTRLI